MIYNQNLMKKVERGEERDTTTAGPPIVQDANTFLSLSLDRENNYAQSFLLCVPDGFSYRRSNA